MFKKLKYVLDDGLYVWWVRLSYNGLGCEFVEDIFVLFDVEFLIYDNGGCFGFIFG